MMDERRVADYFVIAGLPEHRVPLDDFSSEGASLKPTHNQAPITDVTVIFPSLGEPTPPGYTRIETTTSGLFPADLNHGSLRSPSVYLCYKRGRDKSPLTDIGVLYDWKENIKSDCNIVQITPSGRVANVNNSGSRIFITYRRAPETAPCNELFVTDIGVILTNKGETAPHAFCVITQNLNRGMVGSDVYLCYKKSMNRANSIAYKPAILGRYPFSNHASFPLPESVPLFCLPMGATIERWSPKAHTPEPVSSTFILTVSDAVEKVYGAAVMFYEHYPADKLTAEETQRLGVNELQEKGASNLHANKCICILSHWPFFDTFNQFLLFVHNMSLSSSHPVPIEKYVAHFMHEIPFPSAERSRILIQLDSGKRIALAQPEYSPLPLSGASFRELLVNLGPDNCLTLLLFALTEQKILIHSLRPSVLTSVAEAVSMLIFPFHWQCPYIPLCPLGLSDVLCAPMPFIVGVDSRYFDLYEPPGDVNCVDLDTRNVTPCEEKKAITAKLLPKKPARVLRSTLQHLSEKIHQQNHVSRSNETNVSSQSEDSPIDLEFKLMKNENMLELEIQDAFLHFMATILKGFHTYLLPITRAPTISATDPNSLFDLHGFLKSRDKAHHRFFAMLMKTQMFTRFIEERSFVSDKDASLAFFDECTEKVDGSDGSHVRFLEVDDSHQSERTVVVPPPEVTGLVPGVTYSYGSFELNPKLLIQKEVNYPLSVINRVSTAPNSPLSRRTKQEIRSAQKLAKRNSDHPFYWTRCLLSYCYSLWFIHLPSYVRASRSKAKALRIAYEIVIKMQTLKIQPFDEVCYRVLMQLCGQYSQPIIAVKVYFAMRRCGIQFNAVTYGYYNKAVFESKWSTSNSSSLLLWTKLRNVVMGVAQFKRLLQVRNTLPYQESDADGISRDSTDGTDGSSPALFDESNNNNVNNDTAKDVPVSTSSGVTSNDTGDFSASGGQSDVGYFSMNTDETCKASNSAVTSSDGVTDQRNTSGTPQPDWKSKLIPKVTQHPFTSSVSSVHGLPSLDFGSLELTDAEECRSRLGSIVRSSLGSYGSVDVNENMQGDKKIDGSTLDEVFVDEVVTANVKVSDRMAKDSDLSKKSADITGNAKDAFRRPAVPTRRKNVRSSLISPPLTPVTHDDPLGVFTTEVISSSSSEEKDIMANDRAAGRGSPARHLSAFDAVPFQDLPSRRSLHFGSEKNLHGKGRVARSSSFCDGPKMAGANSLPRALNRDSGTGDAGPGGMHRSPTLPSAAVLAEKARTLPSSLAGLRSSLRLSTWRPAETLWSGGLNSIRSATSSLTSKLTEIKEAMSTSSFPMSMPNTPSKGSSYPKPCDMENLLMYEDEDLPGANSVGNCGDGLDIGSSGLQRKGSATDLSSRGSYKDDVDSEEGNGSGSTSETKRSRRLAGGEKTLMNLLDELPEMRRPTRNPPNVALEVLMCTCTRCHTCSSVLYDEEIIAGWSAEDSNLNSRCQFCDSKVVPMLVVTVRDFNNGVNSGLGVQDTLSPAMSTESMLSAANMSRKSSCDPFPKMRETSPDANSVESAPGPLSPTGSPQKTNTLPHPLATDDQPVVMSGNALRSGETLNGSLPASAVSSTSDVREYGPPTTELTILQEPITVPYLSPIVLRKELESVLESEGDVCLTNSSFVDQHPIVYWNLLWFFKRVDLPSHLPNLCLNAKSIVREREPTQMLDTRNVLVRCMWDNPKLHDTQGLYQLSAPKGNYGSAASEIAQSGSTNTKEIMDQIISRVQGNDLLGPITTLLKDQHNRGEDGKCQRRSLYRELMFLTLVALGQENIDLIAFDREYVRAYDQLSAHDTLLLQECDKPPSVRTMFCRKTFQELEL